MKISSLKFVDFHPSESLIFAENIKNLCAGSIFFLRFTHNKNKISNTVFSFLQKHASKYTSKGGLDSLFCCFLLLLLLLLLDIIGAIYINIKYCMYVHYMASGVEKALVFMFTDQLKKLHIVFRKRVHNSFFT